MAESESEKRKKKLLEEINKILKKYDWRESEIPINDEYWVMMNTYRTWPPEHPSAG